jgi:signal transduction histidine kinase
MEGAHCLLWLAEVEETGEGSLRWNLRLANEQSAQRFLPLDVPEGFDFADAWYTSRLLDDRERTDIYGSQETRAGRSYQQEFRCHSKDGVMHWLSENVHVEVISEGKWRSVGVCTDITERKRAEEATRAMTKGAQCLLWYASVEEQAHGLHWSIEMTDAETAQQFFPVAHSPGSSYIDALVRARLPEDTFAMCANATDALRNGRAGYTNQYRCLRADGEWRWLNEVVRIETLKPGQWRCVGVSTDVTEQKRAEEERDRFLKAKLEADAANHAKSEFLSRMSHELRTPLNAILGFGQILDKGTLAPLQKESVQYILNGGRHLLSLINEILDLARVEAGHIELSPEPIALSEIVCESCSLVRPLAAERSISLAPDHAAFGRSYVLADRQRLKQALINLLSNAIKYNRMGGEVQVYGLSRPENRFAIAIQDTGPGIRPEDQQRLFLPFERLNASSEIEGTGLGLAMAHRLTAAMGGSLTVESLPGEGSTFFLELPLVPSPLERLAEQSISICEPEPGKPKAKSATILYIEDNPSNMRLMEVLLHSRPGIALLTATQGSAGLEMAQKHVPDLILLDLNLPDISGQEVLIRLQASALTRDIPVIVLSADATASQIARLKSAGARAYLTKPLEVTEFLQNLDTILPA